MTNLWINQFCCINDISFQFSITIVLKNPPNPTYHIETIYAGHLVVIANPWVRLCDQRLKHLVHDEQEIIWTESLGTYNHFLITENVKFLLISSVVGVYM